MREKRRGASRPRGAHSRATSIHGARHGKESVAVLHLGQPGGPDWLPNGLDALFQDCINLPNRRTKAIHQPMSAAAEQALRRAIVPKQVNDDSEAALRLRDGSSRANDPSVASPDRHAGVLAGRTI